MIKRLLSVMLTVSLALSLASLQSAFAADEDGTTEISNQYIRVVVNNKNGGYVISTREGDVLKKSDDNAMLTHRGENYDTSFTSFQADGKEYVFGEEYGLFGSKSSEVVTEADPEGNFIKSTWSAEDFEVEQNISLVNNDSSEQLGTAMITYTVRNNSQSDKSFKSRVLIDTQLGEKDYGYYEVPKQNLGQGYEYFKFERTWDSSKDASVRMPSDYFVRDNPYSSDIVAYGVNSVFTEQKPYKMTFAHWANIAATVFDYEPDETLNFTNSLNAKKTADSAAALYYDLGAVAAGGEKSFSTYYGVTANLKNKENKIIINTTAPSKLSFKDDSRTAYTGSEGTDNVVRINVNLTNPQYAGKNYKSLAVVAYALGFETQRQTDGGSWIVYDNADPVYTDILDFGSGENRVTYFDFKFTPQERAQLGSFVIKVFDMDESVNELGHYAEEYCLAATENHIILPGRDASLPAITLTGLAPETVYNRDIRYITVSGRGAEFFRSDLLDKIYLRGENGESYEIPIENLMYDGEDASSGVTIMLEDYMEPGEYRLHFLWKSGAGEPAFKSSVKNDGIALHGVPQDFTSDGMTVRVSADEKYANAFYGIVTVQRGKDNKYKLVPYNSEAAFKKAGIDENDLLLTFRGDISQDRANKSFYRLMGKDKDVNINHILNYHGNDLSLEEKTDGSVAVLMDGKITTVGANTTVRNGTAAFKLNGGTEYLIPEYSSEGEVLENGELISGQDFIELKWDNAFDTLTTVGGFLIDMKYGVLGKIQNDDDSTKSDIISFGGSLDLGFMTPGGAAAVRQNTAAGARWTTGAEEIRYDDNDDGYTFGLTFDEDSGEFRSQTKEKDIPPTNEEASRVELGAEIHDVLYGGKNPGYIGINMSAHVALPQIVKFLPNKIEGDLSVNTIGGYNVGVDAGVELANLSMAFSLVVKESPSGAPIPDKLYFTIGGFEPGFNVDGLGVVWITGGGGGFDNLYDTIYGKDGIPPLTLLMHVEFDITKIMTGNADLELSLRSMKIAFDNLSLKMLKNAKFLEGGEIAVGWYPNFNMNLSAGVNFLQIMKGRMTITAAAGRDTADFVQFVLNVAIGLPEFIPIVGGMELASAELGGGSQKVWGSMEVLSLIKVGFTYYWGGSIEFTHGNPSGSQDFATLSAVDDPGVKRTKAMFNEMLKPVVVGKDSATGEVQFASVGGNLSYSAGSTAVPDFAERVKKAQNRGISPMSRGSGKTEIFTNNERTSHLISFGRQTDYILSVSRADGKELSEAELKKDMSVKQGGSDFGLNYYNAPDHSASDAEKTEALRKANINITGNAAYIAIPKTRAAESVLIEFADGNAYDVSVIEVKPISELTSASALLSGNILTVNWNGENITDTAKIIVSVTDGSENGDVVLNEKEISANAKTADLAIPERLASGEYSVKISLSDEETAFGSIDAGKITVANLKAPQGCERVSIENCGNDMLRIAADASETNFDGYMVEVYEDGKLADTGLFFKKGEEILVGGRYEMPVMGADGKPTGKSTAVGYTPGKKYTAKVRLCNIAKDSEGNEIYWCSAYKMSDEIVLKASTQPKVKLEYDKAAGAVRVKSDVPISGELYINSQTADGDWYEFKDKSAEIVQSVSLADGDYTVEFHAIDEDGDSVVVQDIIRVDTTAPTVMLASPKNGSAFGGGSVTVTAMADSDADYFFKVNGKNVLPQEQDIFADGMMKATLPLGDAAKLAKAELEIIARDKAGNETVKTISLLNQKIPEITSIEISASDKTVTDGRLTLAEGESAKLSVLGISGSEKIDITELSATSLEITGGTAASLSEATVTAGLAGQTLIRAAFAIGGSEALTDGIVVETTDNAINYEDLKKIIAEAKQITNDGYTNESWNNLQNAISGAEQLLSAAGAAQSDIDNASTAVSNAIAALETRSRGSSSGSKFAYYTVAFNTNGGGSIKSQRLQSGNKAVKPENPVKSGFTFDGWYADKHLTSPYDFESGVIKSFTLYAKWIENSSDEWENPFADVSESDWFFKNIEYAVKNGLFNGTSTDLFSPNAAATRAMFVTVLYRAEGEPQVSGEAAFADVPPDAYYADAVLWAKQNGIVNGISESEFAPDNTVTREQIAAIMHRFAQYKGYDVSVGKNTNILSYTDAESISEYAIPAVMYAVGAGLIKGRTDSTINPRDNAERAEIAAILQRFLEANK